MDAALSTSLQEPTHRLKLSLFGPFQAWLNGELVSGFDSVKVRALLAYLAGERTAQKREHLAALLWPEKEGTAGRKSLRQALYNLGKLLHNKSASPPLLQVTRGSVALHLDTQTTHHRSIEMDVLAFEKLVQDYPGRSQMEQAIELYKGEFLAELNPEDCHEFCMWADAKRAQYKQKLLSLLYQLTDTYLGSTSESNKGLQYAWMQLELEPWREEAHRQVMLLLAQTGQKSAALDQYNYCEKILRDELGVGPDTRTKQLLDDIQAGLHDPSQDSIVLVRKQPTEPVQTEAPSHSSLPVTQAPLWGRELEVRHILRRLKGSDCRLLSLVGPGGVGKTRLAVHCAQELESSFPDGVFFLSLLQGEQQSYFSNQEVFAQWFAEAIGAPLDIGRPVVPQLFDFLRKKSMLVLVDNCELLVEQEVFFSNLLREAQHTRLLLTSREPLGIPEAWTLSLQGLELPNLKSFGGPENIEVMEHNGAVQLFASAAAKNAAEFELDDANLPAVLQICRLVGGIPLALEIAASWVRYLSCQEIADELASSLKLLSTTDSPHQQSIRNVLDYSWSMLLDEEQLAFRQLAVFRGEFSASSATAMLGVKRRVLLTLTERAFLQRNADGGYAFHGFVHHYAKEKLLEDTEEFIGCCERHATFFFQLLDEHAGSVEKLHHPGSIQILQGAKANIRAAWSWCLQRHQFSMLQRLAEVIFEWYMQSSSFSEGLELFQEVVAYVRSLPSPGHLEREFGVESSLRAIAYRIQLGQSEVAQVLLENSLRGNLSGLQQAFVLGWLGEVYVTVGNLSEAQRCLVQCMSLCREHTRERWLADALFRMGKLEIVRGNMEEAQAHIEEGLALFRSLNDKMGVAKSLNLLGNIHRTYDNDNSASHYYQQSLVLFRQLNNAHGIALCMGNLGVEASRREEWVEAERSYRQALRVFSQIGAIGSQAVAEHNIGAIAQRRGDLTQAQHHYEVCLSLREMQQDLPGVCNEWRFLARVSREQGEYDVAWSRLQQSLKLAISMKLPYPSYMALLELVALLHHTDKAEESIQLYQHLTYSSSFSAWFDRGYTWLTPELHHILEQHPPEEGQADYSLEELYEMFVGTD